jgi:choline-sulfatase
MLREGRWKLAVYHGFERPQLFDLVSDPSETRDLGGDPAHAAVWARLEARVRADWDGEWVERNVAGEGIVRQRNRLGAGGPCERWPFPLGANERLTD